MSSVVLGTVLFLASSVIELDVEDQQSTIVVTYNDVEFQGKRYTTVGSLLEAVESAREGPYTVLVMPCASVDLANRLQGVLNSRNSSESRRTYVTFYKTGGIDVDLCPNT